MIRNSYKEELAVCQRGQAVHLSNDPAEARHLFKGKQEHAIRAFKLLPPRRVRAYGAGIMFELSFLQSTKPSRLCLVYAG